MTGWNRYHRVVDLHRPRVWAGRLAVGCIFVPHLYWQNFAGRWWGGICQTLAIFACSFGAAQSKLSDGLWLCHTERT
jgi:hypothetical protein